MTTFKQAYGKVNDFFHQYLLIILVLIVGGYWLMADEEVPMPLFSKSRSYNESMEYDGGAMDMAMAEPMMMRGVGGGGFGGGIVPPVYADDYDPQGGDRKIIKNASLGLEVEDTEVARALVKEEVVSAKGDITNMNSWQVRNGVLGYNMTIRVPSENLENLMANLEKMGAKMNESVNVSDITAQYRDNQARLSNLRAREKRLLELLEFSTENLADVLSVDREISTVRQQIESLEQSQKRNDVNVAYSTLNLSLQPETQIGDIQNPEWNVKKSWRMAVNELFRKAQKIADGAIRLAVLTPIWLPILLIAIWIKRRFFKKHS